MEKSQIQKVLVPGLAVASIIVLVGLLIGLKNEDAPPKKNAAGNNIANSNAAVKPGQTSDSNSEGMTMEVAPVDAAEWKPYGSDGLKMWDVKEGTGDPAPTGSTVTIHYTGWLTSGTVFDSTVNKGEPATFPLGDLIKAWQIGIPGMKPGGIRRLLVPSELGYGAKGRPPSIPGGATLVFEVKLIAFN